MNGYEKKKLRTHGSGCESETQTKLVIVRLYKAKGVKVCIRNVGLKVLFRTVQLIRD